ncbi:MAG: hypothetical protein WAU10_05285, partial [Caldilineaceae bacterium]
MSARMQKKSVFRLSTPFLGLLLAGLCAALFIAWPRPVSSQTAPPAGPLYGPQLLLVQVAQGRA